MEEKSLNVPLFLASLTPALFWKIVAQTSVRGSIILLTRGRGEKVAVCSSCWYIILIGVVETMFILQHQEFGLFQSRYAIENLFFSLASLKQGLFPCREP